MHLTSMNLMKEFINKYLSGGTILDVGSYNVNGSYRKLCDDRFTYTGLDIISGPNVDLVVNKPYNWEELEDESFDNIISGQTLEHVEFFWITMQEMTRVLKENGYICIIAPNGFGLHRYPIDCYRFFSDGMAAMARYVSLDILKTDVNGRDAILIAQKKYKGKARICDLENYKLEN